MAERGPGRPPVEILLAAYNGERWVAEQIGSILAQTSTEWTLVIRDDCSTDGTFEIVADYARRYPDRVVASRRAENSGSARDNFLEMLGESRAPYVMFADDDDVWLAEKVAQTLARMRELEAEHGPDTPLLVHGDLAVTDGALTVVASSMAELQRLDGRESQLSHLVVQNYATGCTVMVNRALADLVRPPFDGAIMHDWWLLLIAGAFGRIAYLDVPLVLHRQHGKNTVGAIDAHSWRYNLRRQRDTAGTARRDVGTRRQAEAFLAAFADRLTPDQAELLRAYVDLPRQGKLARLRTLSRYGFWKNTTLRRLAQLWSV